MRRTGICGAAETLLVDRPVVESHLPTILDALSAAGCELRGDQTVQGLDSRVVPATEAVITSYSIHYTKLYEDSYR